MRFSALDCYQTKMESMRLKSFSKAWQSGMSARVFYPVFFNKEHNRPDLLAASSWGYRVNPKAVKLGRIFIPTNSEIVDGKPKVADNLFLFSRVAPLIVRGEKMLKAQDILESSANEAAKKAALKNLDKEYGDDEDSTSETGVKEVPLEHQPVVGRLSNIISTEAIFVPLDPNGAPIIKDICHVSQDMSNKKLQQLFDMMVDEEYGITEDSKYIEVKYSFGTTGKKSQDGRVDPAGVSLQYSILNKYPDLADQIKKKLTELPDKGEVILHRNNNFAHVDEAEIKSALTNYAVFQAKYLNALSDDEDLKRLAKNASFLKEMSIGLKEGTKAFDACKEALDAKAKEAAETGEMRELLIDNEAIEGAREEAEKTTESVGDVGADADEADAQDFSSLNAMFTPKQ